MAKYDKCPKCGTTLNRKGFCPQCGYSKEPQPKRFKYPTKV